MTSTFQGCFGGSWEDIGKSPLHSACLERATPNSCTPLIFPLGISATEDSSKCIFMLMSFWMEALNVRDKLQLGGWWCPRSSLCYSCPLPTPLSSAHPVSWPSLHPTARGFRQEEGQGRSQPFTKAPLSIHDTEGRQAWATFYSLCLRRTSEASIPSVSRISIWQEILWWAKNIYHLRRETQKCIISAASILPDHFTQTPGREKHYFTVRTLNVVHTLGSFFSYVITTYLGVSRLEQPPERGSSQETSDQP